MAKILHSETAPSGTVRYSLANTEFELNGRKSYETIDAAVLTDAEAHPWLRVEYPEVEVIQGAYVEQLSPQDDAMSRFNSVANDPEEVRKAEQEKADAFNHVALDSGLDQDDATQIVESPDSPPVAETLAAADETSKKKGS